MHGKILALAAAALLAAFFSTATPIAFPASPGNGGVAGSSASLPVRLPTGSRVDAARQLREIRRRMDREKKALSDILKKQGSVLAKLEALKKQLKRSRDRLARLHQEQQILKEESDRLAVVIKELADKLKKQRGYMAGRLRARYRFGRMGALVVLFNAESPSEFSQRRKYLKALYLSDLKKIKEYNALLADRVAARAQLKTRQETLASFKLVASQQRRQLDAEKRSLTSMLRSIREEKSTHEAVLAELESNASRLQGLIADIDNKAGGHAGRDDDRSGFGALRGRLCYPAPGPVLSGFGRRVHPRFNTVTMQNGLEIGAAPGVRVHAVAAGTVRFADWFRGYGNLIILDHGGGYYTVYAHLSEFLVAVGQSVVKGSVIGAVGDTGSLQGPSLYFEVRHHQNPLDPAEWLTHCAF